MKLCFVVNEFFGWGKFGGFGSATRMIATGLAARGIEVDVVTPMRPGQAPIERADGLTIRGFRPWSPRDQMNAYRASDADIYHSQDPSFGTLLCQHAMPGRRHAVTCQDPRTWRDWWIELSCYMDERRYKSLLTWPYEDNPLVWRAVRKADAVFSEAKHIVPKGQKKYRLKAAPQFLPNPVPLPDGPVVKAERPTVCFVGRFDQRKRPELFFELAKRRPDLDFIAVGAANSARMDRLLRQRYGAIPNLELTGFLDRFTSSRFAEILSRSWILVNTAAREGLPVTFLEAASYRCAIVSQVNPDGFASRFGYHAEAGDFEAGLQSLLRGERWQSCGQAAYDYVRATHALDVVIDKHLAAYRLLMRSAARRQAVAERAEGRGRSDVQAALTTREHEGARRGRGPFVVWGAAYATPNVGDMAIAQAIVRLLRRDDPKVEIAFVTSGRYKTHLSSFEGVSIVDLGRRPLRVLRLLRRAGLLLVAGGVPFGDSTAALVRFLIFAAAARLAGARIEVVASSAAEARLHPVNEALCRAILSLVRSTAVRDQKSLELLRRLKGEDAVDFVPDLALALDPQSEADTIQRRAFGLADDEPYVVIAPRNFLAGQHYLRTHFAGSFGRTEASALLACLVAVAEALGRERRVVFLPMNVDEDDHVVGLRAAEQLAARGRAPIVIEDRLSVDQTCGLLKGADLVLGMRLHAVILAITRGRPTVALGYAGKVSGFMEWLGLEDDLLALTAPSGRVLEACGRRLCQGVPPHVPAALALARQQINHRFAASGQGPERSLPARSERVTTP